MRAQGNSGGERARSSSWSASQFREWQTGLGGQLMFIPNDSEQKRFVAFGPARLPDPRDEEVRSFVDALVSGGATEFSKVLQTVTE